jgi:hypothetical protein
MKVKNFDSYQLYQWLNHQYDDKLVRHQVIENIYNMIKNKIDSLNLELKISEDDFYRSIIQFIIHQTHIKTS